MGKLAVRMCIGGGVLAVILQFASLWMPFFVVQSLSPVGFLAGYPMIKYSVSLTELTIEAPKFIGIQDLKAEYKKVNPTAEEKKKIAAEKEREAELERLPEKDRVAARKEAEELDMRMNRAKNAYEKYTNERWEPYTCGNKLCVKIKLSQLASLFSNSALMMGQSILPGFPGSHNTGFALYYGGLSTLLLSVVMILVQLLGCGYLYYYSEVK